MTLVAALAASVILAFAVRNPLKKAPVLIYVLAAAVAASGMVLTLAPPADPLLRAYAYAVQKGQLAFGMFAVVMYIGVLPQASKAYGWLAPVRGKLSIVAWILIIGHVAQYAVSFLPRLFAPGGVQGVMLAALVAALALTLLLIALGITSVSVVRQAMKPAVWKRVQRLAYAFFALAYVHLALMLAPSAVAGGATAQVGLAVYTAVVAAYAVLRVARWRSDARVGKPGKNAQDSQEDASDPDEPGEPGASAEVGAVARVA